MLPPRNRLIGQKNFTRVQDQGKVFQSENFGIAFVKREDKEASRFAFIVSTKISKDATERNRIKRIMREAVRYSLVDSKPGFDIAFLAKTPIVRIPTDKIMKEVRIALKAGGFLK